MALNYRREGSGESKRAAARVATSGEPAGGRGRWERVLLMRPAALVR